MNNRTESQRDDHLHKILDATRKTTPSASASVASRHFLDDAATPPCGDARRGIALLQNTALLQKPELLQKLALLQKPALFQNTALQKPALLQNTYFDLIPIHSSQTPAMVPVLS